MNKNAIQKYAIWARNELIAQVKQRAYQYGISDKGYGDENAAVIAGRVLSTEERNQRREFVEQIQKNGYQQAIEEVAYTWFNRFIALRFMEVNDYLPTHVRVFSDANGGFNPEILKDVLHLELEGLDKSKVSELLNANQTEELYRYLLLAQCNALNAALPEMFEKLGSYTEMLLPNNILKQDSVLARLVKDIDEDDWKDAVQIIGWMYQYYNTEPKQSVFNGLKKNVKITKEKIPAATQLFTPDWIVRYMVENSLGRLWLESYPNDDLKANWKYYLDEAEQTPEVTEKLRILRSKSPVKSPEDIRLIDPCMGSGHILVYAFDVLMQIYEREGYNPRDAARLILKKNIYGLEIDKRAYQLAYFALMMKARQYNRRILTFDIKPNVFYFIDSNRILKAHIDLMGADLMPVELSVCRENIPHLLNDFSDATEYGSLLKIDREYPYELLRKFAKSQKTGQMTISDNPQNYYDTETSEMDLLQIIDLAETLALKYDVVVTNPPYMGNMPVKMADYVIKNYPTAKYDLYSVMVEVAFNLVKDDCFVTMITQQAWMYLSSFESFRQYLSGFDYINMLHLGARAFDEISGEIVQTTAFVFRKTDTPQYLARFIDLRIGRTEAEKIELFQNAPALYTSNKLRFAHIPGNTVAYWLSDKIVKLFDNENLSTRTVIKSGIVTGNNDLFLKLWYEISFCSIRFDSTVLNKDIGWVPMHKGGGYRKYYGLHDYVMNLQDIWYSDKVNGSVRRADPEYYFREGITWSTLSNNMSARMSPKGFVYDTKGSMCFANNSKDNIIFLALMNSKICDYFMGILSPTLDFNQGAMGKLPLCLRNLLTDKISNLCKCNISLSRADWDSFETSWDFKRHPIVPSTLEKAEQEGSQFAHSRMEKFGRLSWHYDRWKDECNSSFDELRANEEELNRIFIEIYGLQNELTPDVEDKDVTISYIYDSKENIPESMKGSRYALTKQDVIKSLISYAVGCMFGRYSLDEDGLILAGQPYGEKFAYASVPVSGGGPLYRVQGDCYLLKSDGTHRVCTYTPDKDNILPICDDEYFDDDILGRFVDFIRVAYGAETLEENLKFIADALGGKGTPREVIREYFLNGFYKDHGKIYQKRPIYWLFDSGKKNGFKALIYMHRYSRDLLAKLRTDYVHEQQERYRTQISHIATALDTATGADRARLLKQQDKLTEQLKEITAFEEKVHHLADQHIEIDLDDGVKKNYEIFTDVLAKI